MQITTWFGKVELDGGAVITPDDNGMITPHSPEQARIYPIPQPDLRALAMAAGLFADCREYNEKLREFAIALVERKLREAATAEEDLLMAMEALDGMSHAINLLDERLYEWSRLHSQKIVHGRDLAEGLTGDGTMGRLATAILSLRESRKSLESEVSSTVESLAPNLSALAGPVLAARLISRAGGLARLAAMPSSRVQVMGAEKSLFKHLRGNAPSPKHGIIYRHPAVISSPRKIRGKTARVLAAKLSIAARLDFNRAGLSLDLQASLEARLKHIKQTGRINPRARG
ncbi:MAG: Nucleolar protein 56 [Euryarchaeota archaeon]|nr:Nucleolar protein 56 [Euryarchaeota archaeon]